LTKAFQVVNDPTQCRDALALCNFDKFLTVLSYSVGGEENQLSLIDKQIQVATARLSHEHCLADELQIILDRCQALGKPTDELPSSFWKAFDECEASAFAKFTGPDQVAALASPMKQLTTYYKFTKSAAWKGEQNVVVERMKQLIRRQFGVLFEQKATWTMAGCRAARASSANDGILSWKSLSPLGWQMLFDSILITANHERKCLEHFGQEMLWLGNYLRECSVETAACPIAFCLSCQGETTRSYDTDFCESCNYYFNSLSNKGMCGVCKYNTGAVFPFDDDETCINCLSSQSYTKDAGSYLQIKYVDGRLEPVHLDAYKRIIGIDVPLNGPCDPGHCGHLVWEFCQVLY
jgi:hypothetical protein